MLVDCCTAEISCLVRFCSFCQFDTGLTHLERSSLEEIPLLDRSLGNYVEFFFHLDRSKKVRVLGVGAHLGGSPQLYKSTEQALVKRHGKVVFSHVL